MSKGNRIVKLRVDPALFSELEEAIERNNRHSFDAPWDLSSWIRDAIVRKLDHQDRSRAQRQKRRKMSMITNPPADQAEEGLKP